MLKYVLMIGSDGEPVACSSCGFEAPLREFRIKAATETALYCELCAGSFISSAHEYPNQQDFAAVIRAIGYVGNAILARLGQFDGAEEVILPPESGDEQP